MVRINANTQQKDTRWVPVSWKQAFDVIRENGAGADFRLTGIIGQFVDQESILSFKKFINKSGSSNPYIENSQNPLNKSANEFSIDFRANYLLNSNFSSFAPGSDRAGLLPEDDTVSALSEEDLGLTWGGAQVDHILLISNNPLLEAQQKLEIASIGGTMDLTYPVDQLGNGGNIVLNMIQGKAEANRSIISSKNPPFPFGINALQRSDGASLKEAFRIVNRFRNEIHEALDFSVLYPQSSDQGPRRKKASSTKHKF